MSTLALRRFSLLVFAGFLVSTASAQEAPKLYRPAVDLKKVEFRADWYGVYLKDRKVGYMREERQKLPDGSIRETEQLVLRLLSFGQKTEMTINQTSVYDGKAPHHLLKAEFVTTDGKNRQTVTARKLAEGYELIHEAPGVRQVKVMKDLVYGLPDALATEVWIRQGPKVNDTIAFVHLDLNDQELDVHTAKVLSSKESLVNGVDVRFFEIETESKEKGIKAFSRHDATGLMLSDQVAVFEMRLEPEEKAKNIEFSQDLFVMGMVKIDRGIGNTRAVRELIVEVDGKEGAVFPDGPRQSISADDTKGSRVLRIGKAHGKAVKATEAEIRDALAETPACPHSNPKVQELAKAAVGDAKTPEEKVKRLVAFVHKYVEPHLSAHMPQIEDLIQNKKGDCKAYALLFNNLARAAGVPAREVSGLLYVGDDQKAFGGHAWNEVVLDGVWVPIDASMGETEVNATHISFGSEHRATANLLNTLGKLSFRLVDVKHAR